MCGIGVTSRMDVTSSPADCKDLTAASLPAPGPLTQTSTLLTPDSKAILAVASAAIPAANGVLFFDPLNPLFPPED